MEWVTSKDISVRTALAGNMNPVRTVGLGRSRCTALMESWGETPGQYIAAAKTEAEVAALRFPPHPELTRMLDRWAEAIQQSWLRPGRCEDQSLRRSGRHPRDDRT